MLQLFVSETIKLLAFPLYCFCALTLASLFLWSVWQASQDGVARLRRLHQIPCDRCAFFTGDYRLKCTVYPLKALSEEAIDCLDFQSTPHRAVATTQKCQSNCTCSGFNC